MNDERDLKSTHVHDHVHIDGTKHSHDHEHDDHDHDHEHHVHGGTVHSHDDLAPPGHEHAPGT